MLGVALLASGKEQMAGLPWMAAMLVLLALADACEVALARVCTDAYNGFMRKLPLNGGNAMKADECFVLPPPDLGLREAGQVLGALGSFSVWPFYGALMAMVVAVHVQISPPKVPAPAAKAAGCAAGGGCGTSGGCGSGGCGASAGKGCGCGSGAAAKTVPPASKAAQPGIKTPQPAPASMLPRQPFPSPLINAPQQPGVRPPPVPPVRQPEGGVIAKPDGTPTLPAAK